jgi:hypothetical protein
MPDCNRLPARFLKPPRQEFPVLRPTGHFAGRICYHTLVNNRTRTLPTWLFTTFDRNVALRIAALLGAQPGIDDDSEQRYQIFTNHTELDVLLGGPLSIRLRMLRRHGSTVVCCCNGRTQRTPFGQQPCQCPPTLKGRWQAAKAGHGCEPLVHVAIRLAADPTLGRFLLAGATWMFTNHAATVKAALRQQHGPVRARLSIDRTLHTTGRGTTFAYTRPSITILSGS